MASAHSFAGPDAADVIFVGSGINSLVGAALLRSLGVEVSDDAVGGPTFGHGRPVGRVRPLVGDG